MLKRLWQSDRHIFVIFFILIVALGLRLIGITYGFPFVFHPDEPTVVNSALSIRFFPNPKHFDWPHFYIYLNFALYAVFAKIRDIINVVDISSTIKNTLPLFWDDSIVFYFLTRLFSGILSALTIIPVYLSAKRLFGIKPAVDAAAFFTVSPFHVMHSHYSLIDAPMVFFVCWAIYFSIGIMYEKKLSNYIWAGLFIGFAASTKYNGGLTALMVPFAHFLRVIGSKEEKVFSWEIFRNLSLSGIACFAAFLLGTPYALLDYATFFRTDGPQGAMWQFTNVGSVGLGLHINQFISVNLTKLINDLGYTPYILFIVGIVSAVRYKSRRLLFLIVPSLFLIWYISGFVKTRSHYFMVTYPFIAIVAGYILTRVVFYAQSFLNKLSKIKVELVVVALFLSIPFILSVRETVYFANKDTRVIYYEWVLTTNSDEHIVYDGGGLIPVMEAFDNKKSTKSKNIHFDSVLATKGYVVLIRNSDEDPRAQFHTDDTLYDLEEYFDKVSVILPHYSRGPAIYIYKTRNEKL